MGKDEINTERRSEFIEAIENIQNIGPQHPLFKFFRSPVGRHLYKCQGKDFPSNWGDVWEYDENFKNDFCRRPCDKFDEKYLNYGVIGSGSWGTVFAGRTHQKNDEGEATQLAVKIYDAREDAHYDFKKKRYTCEEIVKSYFLAKVGGCERIPYYYDGMIHGAVAVLVMEPFGVDRTPAREDASKLNTFKGAPRFQGFTGVSLTREKEPLLGEAQVCKIMSHILEALLYLNDRRMVHEDLSLRNFLIDDHLNAKLIDFGYAGLMQSDLDYRDPNPPTNHWVEDMINPEMIIGICHLQYNASIPQKRLRRRTTVYPRINTDYRHVLLWRFACITYTLLHGYAPWDVEDPTVICFPIDADWNDWMYYRFLPNIDARRTRMVNEELPIHERLSPDCADVLNAMLHRDPEKRPGIEELATFPWFQGWYHDSGAEFIRPSDRDPSEGETPPGARTESGSRNSGKRARSVNDTEDEDDEEEEEDKEQEQQQQSKEEATRASKRARVS